MCFALQAPGFPWPTAAGPPGPDGHNTLSDSALADFFKFIQTASVGILDKTKTLIPNILSLVLTAVK